MEVYLSPPGVICCAGRNRRELFDAAIRGDQSGIRRTAHTGGGRFLVGRVEAGLSEPSSGFEGEPAAYTSGTRLIRIADAALEHIRGDVSHALARYGADRIGLCVGSCDNGSEGSLLAHSAFFSSAGAFPSDYAVRFQSAGYLAEVIARKFGVTGPAVTLSTACASSASAVVKAAELIRAGLCDAAIAGGADIASATVLLGFNALEAVSEEVTNPFSKNRKGITLGEGAAFFVLSKGETGNIVLLGAGESADAYHLTAPLPDGSGAILAMRRALAQAGLRPDEVDYLNLHGTGTPLNDRMEAGAVAAVFPDYERRPAVSSTKPITGHTLGAAGALELALCWMMLDASGGSVPAPVHCWDGIWDDELPRLAFADAGTIIEDVRVCMSNSFAFGGCNVSLILGKAGGR